MALVCMLFLRWPDLASKHGFILPTMGCTKYSANKLIHIRHVLAFFPSFHASVAPLLSHRAETSPANVRGFLIAMKEAAYVSGGLLGMVVSLGGLDVGEIGLGGWECEDEGYGVVLRSVFVRKEGAGGNRAWGGRVSALAGLAILK